jgi:hypothetical protein
MLFRIPNKFSRICSLGSISAFSHISTSCSFCLWIYWFESILNAVTSNIDIVSNLITYPIKIEVIHYHRAIIFRFYSFIYLLSFLFSTYPSIRVEEKEKFLIFISLSINSENSTNIKHREEEKKQALIDCYY